MRVLGYIVVTLIALLSAATARADVPAALGGMHHLAIRLVAETMRPAAGSEVTLALDSTPQAGWHGYWQNPGDAGFPAKLAWTLPAGVTADAPAYPMPGTLLIAGLMNYVYERPYAPLVTLHVPSGLSPGASVPVKLALSYLVCSATVCVPEKADLALDLTVGDGAVDAVTRTRFDEWRRAIPKPIGATVAWQASGGRLRIGVPYPATASLSDAYFFPLTPGAIEYAAPQNVTREGDRIVIETKAGPSPGGTLAGVLRIADGQGLAIAAQPGVVAAAATPMAEGGASAALFAFLGALLGGLLLNIMPCVFPILSLKAMSLARVQGDARTARAEALGYTAGVVTVCVALGAVILALRAGGSAIGWAFQLQDPRMIAVLLLLAVALALNFAGLYELPTPRFVNRAGGAGGAFATGALAAFVATPCSGPFMGAALGAALVLPWPAALAVFAGLGLGLALPFLALGFVPALRRLLPKPGAWMEAFRRLMSIPLWLTAIALVWVLGQEIGVDGIAYALVAALGLGIVLWAAGRRQASGQGFGTAAIVMIAAILLAGIWLAGRSHRSNGASAVAPQIGAEPFSEARLASLRATHRPVFAYFTADWCVTCKVNEKAAIETDAVRQAFARKNVAVLVGDWTNGDPVLGRFIEAHNRAGVPLYLYYAPGATEPQVLPQVLTPGLLAAL